MTATLKGRGEFVEYACETETVGGQVLTAAEVVESDRLPFDFEWGECWDKEVFDALSSLSDLQMSYLSEPVTVSLRQVHGSTTQHGQGRRDNSTNEHASRIPPASANSQEILFQKVIDTIMEQAKTCGLYSLIHNAQPLVPDCVMPFHLVALASMAGVLNLPAVFWVGKNPPPQRPGREAHVSEFTHWRKLLYNYYSEPMNKVLRQSNLEPNLPSLSFEELLKAVSAAVGSPHPKNTGKTLIEQLLVQAGLGIITLTFASPGDTESFCGIKSFKVFKDTQVYFDSAAIPSIPRDAGTKRKGIDKIWATAKFEQRFLEEETNAHHPGVGYALEFYIDMARFDKIRMQHNKCKISRQSNPKPRPASHGIGKGATARLGKNVLVRQQKRTQLLAKR